LILEKVFRCFSWQAKASWSGTFAASFCNS